MLLDIVIANARVIDGTGAPWFVGAVGIKAGRIAGVYEGEAPQAVRVIDAKGAYVSPGFIDVHTHDDVAFLRNGMRLEKISQGITTIVTGNCSFSNYPAVEASAPLVAEHLGTLLGSINADEVHTDYASFRAALGKTGMGPNVVSLVGHAPLRLAVLGMQARAATAAERAAMEDLLDIQLRQGSAGLSLGLVYAPGSWADDEELIGLARVTARHGRLLAAHIRNYDDFIELALEEFLSLLERSGAKGQLSHLQVCGRGNWGKMPALLDRLELARKNGIDVSCDMYPYTAGSSTILQLLPPSALAGGTDAILGRMADPQQLHAIRSAVVHDQTDELQWKSKVGQIGWENIRIGGVEVETHRAYEGKTFAQIAQEEQRDPFDVAAGLIVCDCCRTNIIMFQQDERDLKKVLQHRLFMCGSDSIPRASGKPHPRGAGSFARLVGSCAIGEDLVPIEEMIRHLTSLPAQRFGLWDRGILRPGLVADIVIFNADIRDHATYDEPHLPPSGVETVLVRGIPLIDAQRPTSARPGLVLDAGQR